MDPNEILGGEPIADTPVSETQPETVNESVAESVPEVEPVAQAEGVTERLTPDAPEAATQPEAEQPIYREEPQSGAYHGAGAGRKESPYANSPYLNAYQPRQDSQDPVPPRNQNPYQSPYQYQPQPPRQKKERKPMGKGARRVIAAGLAVVLVLVAGSCGITASVVNNRWENEVNRLEENMEQRLNALQDQVNRSSGGSSGVSVSGSPVAAEGLTPAQVYAQNVNSVVGVSNYGTYSVGWGGSVQDVVSTGSGFIISEDGYVITNYHVVEGAEKLTFTTCAGDEYEAALVGSDELNDVALLKADVTGLDPVEIGSSDDLIIGDMVVAIGNPLGELTSTQTVGYVSGKDRSVSTDGSIINMLQTDAAINSGNSGGPLFNMYGQVIGITTAKYSGDSGSGASIEGIGFAIPIDDVMGMIDDFKEFGYLKNQAYLGVVVRDLTASNASEFSLPSGAYVTEVNPGSSAEKAGVQAKDIIIGLGDYDVGSMAELTSTLRRFSAGDTTTITVYRGGQELELTITFDEKPASTDTEIPAETLPGEMPDSGSYDEWYEYFAPYFGGGSGDNYGGYGHGYGFGG